MTFSVDPSSGALRYDEPRSAPLRVTLAVVAILAIASSGIFVFVAQSMGDVSTWAKVGGLLASIVSMVAFLAFGAYCLRLALWMPRHLVSIDTASRQLVWIALSPLGGRRTSIHRFDTLSSIGILERRSDENPTTFTIAIGTETHGRLDMGVFNQRSDAEAMLRRVRTALGMDS